MICLALRKHAYSPTTINNYHHGDYTNQGHTSLSDNESGEIPKSVDVLISCMTSEVIY